MTSKAMTNKVKTDTLTDALARHNAKNPGGQLVDITAQIEEAAAVRLCALLAARDDESGALVKATTDFLAGERTPHHRFQFALLVCAMCAVGRSSKRTQRAENRIRWEEMNAALEGDRSERSRLITRRLTRAYSLLRLLVWTGCLRRKEVQGQSALQQSA